MRRKLRMAPRKNLSPRMCEVATLVAGRGFSYQEVSQSLDLSESTVKRYAEEIGRRLGGPPKRMMFEWYSGQQEGERDAA